MVAAVNPCGFAMLPSYLGLYLGTDDGSEGGEHLGKRFLRGLRISGTVSASFVVLFGIAGIALSLASAVIAKSFPWVGLAVGFMLVFGGGRMLAGGTLYASFGERMADRMRGGVRQPGLRGYFAYGLAYGLASLSCTLPIFLAVVGSALAVNGLLAGMVQFVLYAAGMGLVISALTLGVALFKHAALGGVRRVLPFVQPLSALLLLVAGAYIIYYWLTLGGLLRSIRL
jgi:cytochrome c biogenesis protein CcdA